MVAFVQNVAFYDGLLILAPALLLQPSLGGPEIVAKKQNM